MCPQRSSRCFPRAEVVLGPTLVWLGVGEVPGALTLVGGTIVLGAISVQAFSGIRRRRPPLGVL